MLEHIIEKVWKRHLGFGTPPSKDLIRSVIYTLDISDLEEIIKHKRNM